MENTQDSVALTLHSADDHLRTLVWYGLLVVGTYFLVASAAMRWRPRWRVRVAQYEPPAGVSPAVAAYVWERGVSDTPFVVALANMASKGYLRIEQGQADYLLSRADGSGTLTDEEQAIADTLFPPKANSLCLSQLFKLGKTARLVRGLLESAVEPDLISPHFPCFIPGLTLSIWCFIAALSPEWENIWNSNAGGATVIPALLAVWALLAMTRTLPTIFYKLKSHLPGRTPRPLPFVKKDLTVLGILLVVLSSLALIAWITSLQFALQFAGFLVVNLLGALALRAPTAAGHSLLGRLADFHMFLTAVDSDRVNRMNAPDAPSPAGADKYWPWALALGVEHAWGEQFAAAVLNRLGPSSAMDSIESNCPEDRRTSADLLDLHLR